jgi:hypothetical protein
MYTHNTTQALAEARSADQRRAATHNTATVPPRRHRRHRRALALLGVAATATLTTVSAVALLAAGAGSAAARPADMPLHGSNAAHHAQAIRTQSLNYRITHATLPRTVNPRGPYGVTTATLPDTVKARGPYGVATAAGSPDTTGATARAGGASGRDGANGWRTAAISEAALLAALALGLALLLPARRRAVRVVS